MSYEPTDRLVDILIAERIRQNLSLRQLAKRIPCSRSNLSYLEMGRHSPTLHMTMLWANALGFVVDLKKVEIRDQTHGS